MQVVSIHANNYLNHPVLNSVTTSGDQVTVNYDFEAPSVIENLDNEALFTSDLVGFRLDFYINDNTKDGAYSGYSQQKTCGERGVRIVQRQSRSVQLQER